MKENKKKKKRSEHYVNNKEFSQAVVTYVTEVNLAKLNDEEIPIIPNYIGEAFMKICTGLSHAPNFIRYSYRDEMINDGLANCVKAIMNYDVTAATRSGLPNAFGYFTQITFFAFVRRIKKENKQYDIKLRYMESAGIGAFAHFGEDLNQTGDSMIGKIRNKTDSINQSDQHPSLQEESVSKKKFSPFQKKKKEVSAISDHME